MTEKTTKALFKSKKIYQIINPKMVQASPDISVGEATALMRKNGSGYVVLAKNKKVYGIFTETDLARKVLEKDVDLKKSVREFMTKDPATLNPKDEVGKAIELMGSHRFYHVPLVDENKELTGILSVRTLIRFIAEFYPTEIYNLPPNPNQVMETPEGG